MKPKIGDIAKDNITGFSGLIDAKIEYLTGCTQFRLQPRELKDSKIQECVWFDENRLTTTEAGVLPRQVTDLGGPAPVLPARIYPR
jgi:hypothetical protein